MFVHVFIFDSFWTAAVGIVVTKEQRRTCLKKLNTNIQNGRARNITSSLDQRIPHKFAAIDGTASDSRMHFDTFGQLDSGDFELISLQNNRLIALGRLDAVNGLHSVDWNQVLLNLNSITANQLNELLKHTESTSESTFVGPEAKTQLPAPTVATPTYGMRLGVASVSAEEPEVKDMPDAEPEVEMLRPVSISTSTLESLTRPSSRIASEQNLDRRTSNLIKSTNRTVNSSSSRLFEHSVKEEDLAMDRRLATLILIFSTGNNNLMQTI